MRTLRLLLIPLVLVACTDQTPVAPIEDGPVFNWMNNPDNGNFRVVRVQEHFATFWTDPSNGLRVGHTTFPLADPDCSPMGLLEPAAIQSIQDINEDDFLLSRLNELYHADDIFILVRDLNQPGDCFGAKLIATGYGSLRGNDNDLFAWYPFFVTGEENDRNNANSFGYRAQGKLTAIDGTPMRYNGVYRFVWDPDGIPPVEEVVAKVNLK